MAKKTIEVTQEPAFKPSVIHIETLKDGKLQVHHENVNFDTILRMTIPVIVNSAKKIYQVASEQKENNVPALTAAQLEDLKLMMYDTMNIAFANALDEFAPEIEARPNITADAILKAQNELMEEEMKAANYNPSEVEVKEAYENLTEKAVEEAKNHGIKLF